MIEKRVTRGRARGKIFWGCNKYPKCDFASWTNPLNPPVEGEAGATPADTAVKEEKEEEKDDAPQEDEEKNPES